MFLKKKEFLQKISLLQVKHHQYKVHRLTKSISQNENSFGDLKTPTSLIMTEIQSQRKMLLDRKKVITTERTSSVLKNITTEGKGSVQRTLATESIGSVSKAKATKVLGSVPLMIKNKRVT